MGESRNRRPKDRLLQTSVLGPMLEKDNAVRFDTIRLEQQGQDRVAGFDTRGEPPTRKAVSVRTNSSAPDGRRVAALTDRSVTDRPPWSMKVYICFSTTSVASPTPRENSSVASMAGIITRS